MRLARRLSIAAAIVFLAFGSEPIPQEPAEAHRYADRVLYPKLVGAFNEFSMYHGNPDGVGHFNKLNKDDIPRVREMKKAFDAWYEAMKRGGYTE